MKTLLEGPQGPKGAQGAPGAAGETGATGPQGPAGPGTVVGPTNCTSQMVQRRSTISKRDTMVKISPDDGLPRDEDGFVDQEALAEIESHKSSLEKRNSIAKRSSDPFVGEIMWTATNYCPTGWARTNGQTLPINQNTALFSLLGTNYGGNGQTTFNLPNLNTYRPGCTFSCIALQGIYPSRP
ncbi:receptor-binding domain of short tail fiber protein gp12 [Meredithblackwellia eburnea MCA 4105]